MRKYECAQSQLLKAASDPCQTQITDYFQVLNDIEELLKTNSKLCDLLQQYRKDQSETVGIFYTYSETTYSI